MLRVLALLAFAAVLGVVAATSSACAIGLSQGTSTWCGFPLVWPIGIVFAVPVAVVLGLPADALYRKFGLRRWWQFVLGGAVLALPLWYSLAEPFSSPRWQLNGAFDTLNYVGSGVFGGLAYWWLRVRNAKAGL
jgi:hypothetical protein